MLNPRVRESLKSFNAAYIDLIEAIRGADNSSFRLSKRSHSPEFQTPISPPVFELSDEEGVKDETWSAPPTPPRSSTSTSTTFANFAAAQGHLIQPRRKARTIWQASESLAFQEMLNSHPNKPWRFDSDRMPGKSPAACKNKYKNLRAEERIAARIESSSE